MCERGLERISPASEFASERKFSNTGVIDLPAARVNRLQKFVHLFVAHLLAEVREDYWKSRLAEFMGYWWTGRARTVSKLADTDETRHIFIEDLKSAAVLFRFTRITKPARSIEDFREGVEVDLGELAENLCCLKLAR